MRPVIRGLLVMLARRVTCGVAVVAFGAMMLMSASAWGDTSVTFGFTGGFQSLTLPRGVPAVTVRVEGGRGGDGALGGGTGGTGATVSATFSVPTTGTQTLQIYVGGAGVNGCVAVAGQPPAPGCGSGVYHDGGVGAFGFPSYGYLPFGGGGGGGSASSVYLGFNGLVTAGGGGGGGGGRGGPQSGGNGGQSSANAGGGLGGGGGTQTAGGIGGTGGSGGADGFSGSDPSAHYIADIGGQGGAFGGGGGGGGYHGGGGGGASSVQSGLGSGGGGGGSNFVAPSATNVSIQDGTVPGISGAVTVTYPPPTSTPPPPTTDEEKGFAVFDFLHLLPQTAVECDNIQLLADFLAPFSDVDLVPAITDLCNADVDRLVDDFFIYLDPPDKRIGVVAVPVKVSATDVRLPVCPRRGHDAARCRRLRPELVSYVTAARQVTSIDDALHTTFDRLSSARQLGNAAAIELQTRTASNLSARLHQAIAARAKLRGTIAARLAMPGRRVRLTRAQDANAIARLLRRLEKAGLPRNRLRALAGKALTPRSVDLLSLL